MAHDTRSSRKTKDDENNNSKGRQISSKGSSTSGSGASDTPGLRRSARETLLKKNVTLSPSSPRKSERLEKKMPETPLFKRKSERFEKKLTPSPLRRSDRAKNLSSTSSGSKRSDKSSGSSLMKRKKEKEKSVQELTLESREVIKIEKENVGPGHLKNKIRNARAYKALFMKHGKKLKARDNSEKESRQNKVSQGGSNDCRGGAEGPGVDTERIKEKLNEEFVGRGHGRSMVGSDSSINKLTKETSEDDRGVDLSRANPRPSCIEEASEFGYGDDLEICGQRPPPSSYNAMMEEINDAPQRERVHVDCSAMEMLKVPELTGSTCKSGQCVIPSKRKRNMENGDSDTSAVNASKDAFGLISDAVSSLPSGTIAEDSVEICGACFKRQRIETDQLKLEFCSCSIKLNQEVSVMESSEKLHPDREHISDSNMGVPKKLNNCMQQKEFSLDLQSKGDRNTCLICSLGGKLLCCGGRECRRSYHLSCLDPPMGGVPLGVWYCSMCVRKKIESGIYSVSEGIETIWDAREVEDVDGLQKRKEFFVKYKGLAHIHNQWVPESKVLLEAPTLVGNFNQNNQVTRWKKEWTVPCRLLQRRSLMSRKQPDNYLKEHTGDTLFCHDEWLVKWHGLNYDSATWELENAAFLSSSEVQGLIRDYENRRQRARKFSSSSEMDKILESRKCSSVKLSQLPAGDLSGFDSNCLDNVNRIRELWHKGENSIVVYDKERIAKVIAFILSLHSDSHGPFLIISTHSKLCCWDDEFFHLAPSLNVVVYSGCKDLRKSIRTIEFDEAGDSIMFQVLVTSPEAIIEDKNVFERIGWETIIIDECHRPEISQLLVQINMLPTHNWLLLVSRILKESGAEYLCLLSLLDPHSDSQNFDHLLTGSSDIIGKLKDRLSRYISHGCKPDSSRFREYWVPVQISTVQLEQYCENLLLNTTLILSSAKKDLVGALQDIVLSARKCFDHPYIVHPPLQALLTKDLQAVEYLDVGIQACGKLRLLDMMLKEIKNRSLRVLILFQSISGSGSVSPLGDILDDFLRQRYGENSYERVECGVLRSKKDAAMNMFNNKEHGRFVFLLEARACLPSIKLSSVDTVIIYGSDWTPHSDIRALQKISLDSQFEQIKVFRLYSTCTMEERLLIRAKQGKIVDSQVHSINSSVLLWGAPLQFDKLNEFHGSNTPVSTVNILSEESLLKYVLREFLSLLPQDGNSNGLCDLAIISKAQQIGGVYSTEVPLLYEMESQHTGEGQPLSFWTKLLEGKHPQWKYCSGLSQRNRKRVHSLGELSKKPEVGSDEVMKKRKKVVSGNDDVSYLRTGSERKLVPGSKEGASVTAPYNMLHSSPRSTVCANKIIYQSGASTVHNVDINVLENPESNMFESMGRRKLHDAQKSLHQLLKPGILKLCGILQVSDAVKVMVGKFLEYVMSNHHVNREPATILQAFQISLCWTAASFLKQKVDHKESLALAKQHLNFNCKKEEADYVYSMLRCLKKTFLYRSGIFKAAESTKFAKLSSKDVLKNSHTEVSQAIPSNLWQANSEAKDLSLSQEYLAQKDVSKSIKEIHKKVQKQMTKLIERQSKDKNEVLRTYQEEKEHLRREINTESVVIRSCFPNNTSMRTEKLDKLKMLEEKVEQNENQMELHLERLEASQQEARNKLLEMGKRWVQEVQSWARVELLDRSRSNMPDPWSEGLSTSEGHEDFATVREQDLDNTVLGVVGGMTALSHTPESIPDEAAAYSAPTRAEATQARPLGANGALDTAAVAASCTFMEKNIAGSSGDDQENIASLNPCAKVLITDGGTTGNGEVVLDVPVVACSTVGLRKVVTSCLPSIEKGISNAVTLPISDGDVRLEVPNTVCSSDGPLGPHPLNLSSVQQNPDAAELSMPDRGVPLELHETVSSSLVLQNALSVRAPSSDEPIHLVMRKTASSSDGLGNLVYVDPPSEGQIPENSKEREPVSSSHGLNNIVSASSPSSEEDVIVTGTTSDKEIESGVLETVGSNDGLANHVSVNPLSSEAILKNSTDKEADLGAMQTVSSDDGLENLASADPPSSDVQISEKATERDNIEVCALASDSATGAYQQNGVDSTPNGSSYKEMPLENSPGVQPAALVPGGSVALDQAHQEKGTLLGTPASAQGGDAEASGKQNTCEPVANPAPESVAAVASNFCNHELPNTEPLVQQLLLPSSNTPGDSTPALSSAGGVEIQSNTEDCSINQVPRVPTQLVENLPEASNQTGLRPVTYSTSGSRLPFSDTRATVVTSAFNSRPINAAPQGASRTPLPIYLDPLQNELERLIKQTDHALKSHEDTKHCLKTDCDKEIEEAVAEIRRKYEIRLQETEAEFLLKKKELDSIHNKVLMNKILAEAFRSKCMDLRASGASGVQQEANSSFIQQLVHLSTQDTQRRSPVTRSSLASTAAASLQTSNSPLPNPQMTPPAPGPAIPPASNPHCTAPPMQTVPTAPAPSPRPPHIGSFSSAGIPQVGGGIRAPAPHLQPFRPSTSMSNQQSHINSPSTMSLPHTPRPPAPTQQPVPYNRAHHPESGGDLAALRSLSALGLLMNMNSRAGANSPGSAPSLPNSASNRDKVNVSDPAATGSTSVNPVNTVGHADIVCLSDDD